MAIFQIYNEDMKGRTNGRGRPRKSADDVKSKSILLRLGGSEKEGFSNAATVAGIPLSVWMRERLRRAATRELGEAGRQIPFLA